MLDRFYLERYVKLLLLRVISRYIDAKEPIREKLLFLSPIRSRKGAYPPKQDMGRGDTLNLGKY